MEVVKKFYPNILFDKRPKKYSNDKTPLISVPMYVTKKLNRQKMFYDFVLQVAPTCPFIKTKTIKKIVDLLKSKKSDCVVTLKRIEHEHPYRAKSLNKKDFTFGQFIKNVNVEKFISRQDLPELYCTSGGIYGRTNKLICSYNEKDFCFGKKPMGVIVNDLESVNIDRKIDLEFASYLALKYKI
jgi:CMP-N-acetylneuraminic acid synthetase